MCIRDRPSLPGGTGTTNRYVDGHDTAQRRFSQCVPHHRGSPTSSSPHRLKDILAPSTQTPQPEHPQPRMWHPTVIHDIPKLQRPRCPTQGRHPPAPSQSGAGLPQLLYPQARTSVGHHGPGQRGLVERMPASMGTPTHTHGHPYTEKRTGTTHNPAHPTVLDPPNAPRTHTLHQVIRSSQSHQPFLRLNNSLSEGYTTSLS